MRFTVTARSTTGAIVFERSSHIDALTQALGLSASGMTEVRIADGSGPARSPADLYRAMFGEGSAGSVPDRAHTTADVPLAA